MEAIAFIMVVCFISMVIVVSIHDLIIKTYTLWFYDKASKRQTEGIRDIHWSEHPKDINEFAE